MLPQTSPANDAGVSSGDGRRRLMTSSLWLFAALSIAFVCYSAISSGDYRWLCPNCHRMAALRFGDEDGGAGRRNMTAADVPTNLSHIVFGIGANVLTWDRRRRYSELWWRPGETRGHAWFHERLPNGTWPPESSPPFRISANASRFGRRANAARMARIVVEEYQLSAASDEGQEVRWFVMGDDDTVFFVDNVVAALGKYDHREMYYVGAASESVEQDVLHSYGMAFGGGGFAVSAPAARALAGAMDGCLERYATFYGSDQRVHSCLAELGVPLTREPGFHQMDLKGDVYGMLAAHPVAPLLSLHHLEYVTPIVPRAGGDQLDAVRSLVNASRLDQGRTLQQSFCYEANRTFTWSVSVSWGYTIQLYPVAVAPKDLEVPLQTFKTWRSSSDGPFTFNIRPFQLDSPCHRPLRYFLDRVEEGAEEDSGTNSTVSEYSMIEKNDEEACKLPGYATAVKVDKVRVLAPKMDVAAWQRAPRRQCCQTRRTQEGRELEVRIRDCRDGEVTTPPTL